MEQEQIEYVSPSKAKTLNECEVNFLGKYFYKLPEDVSPKTHLGSILHSIFECLSNPKKNDQIKEYRKQLVIDSARSHSISPVLVHLLDKLLRKYGVPDDLHDLAKDLMLDAFLKGYDVNYPVVGVEDYFEIKITDKIGIRGYIDRVIDVSALHPDTCEAKDYKSGVPFAVEKCKEEYQPYFYIMAIKVLYPQFKNVLFSFHFLKNHKTVHVDISDSQLEEFKKKIVAAGERVKILMKNPEKAIPSKNWKCNTVCNAKHPNKELGYGGCPLYYNGRGEYRFKK